MNAYLHNPDQTKKIRLTVFTSFNYKPPNSPTKKKTDIITVAATRKSTGEIFTQKVSFSLEIY